MRIVLFMAGMACRRSVAVLFVRPVAGPAFDASMAALQHKIGTSMVESCAVEIHNVGLAALMLGMADNATCPQTCLKAPMKTPLLPDIAGNVLMIVTPRALARLPLFAKLLMTGITIGLVALVRMGQFSRHEQSLQ